MKGLLAAWRRRRATALGRAERQVFRLFLRNPGAEITGYDVWLSTSIRAELMYPALDRLRERGWIADGWRVDPSGKKPRRRYYVLTPKGVDEGGDS